MGKIIKKKYIAIFFGSLFLLLYLFIFLIIKSPYVQTWAAGIAANWLSKELQAEVSIKSVDLDPFLYFTFNEVFIGDQNNDTILSVSKISIFFKAFSYRNKNIEIEKIKLQNPIVKVQKDINGDFRHKFIIDYFISDTTSTDTSKSNWNFAFNKLDISKGDFRYKVYGKDSLAFGFNHNNIHATSLNLKADGFDFFNDTITFNIKKLSVKEHCGLDVLKMSSKIMIETNSINLDDLLLNVNNSKLDLSKLAFRFDSFDDFDDFEEMVRLNIEMNSSDVFMEDISYFSSDLIGLDEMIKVSGNFRGTISSLRGRNVSIKVKNVTELDCDFSVSGLPDIDNAFWHIDFHNFYTTVDDIKTMPTYPFESKSKIKIPDIVEKFKHIAYSGKFSGFFSDFVAYGEIKTALGYLQTDILIKQNASNSITNFKGKLNSTSIDIGNLTNTPEIIGRSGFTIEADGYTKNDGSLKAKIKGDIHYIKFKDYKYDNILVEGEITEKIFDGHLVINDPNIYLDFIGIVNFAEKIPEYNFTAELRKGYYSRLGIFGNDSSANVSLMLNARLSGNDIDNINGRLEVFQLDFNSSRNRVQSKKIEIISNQNLNEKEIIIKSDLFDANFSGRFSFTYLQDAINIIADNYFPSLLLKPVDKKIVNKIEKDNYFIDFELYTKNIKSLTDELIPSLKLSDKGKIKGHADFALKQFIFESDFSEIEYDNIVVKNISIYSNGSDNEFFINTNIEHIEQGQSLSFDNLVLTSYGKTDTAFVMLEWNNLDSLSNMGELSGMIRLFNMGSTQRKIVAFETFPSFIMLADTMWYLNEGVVTFSDSVIYVDNIIINHEQQYIFAEGVIGKQNEELNVLISNLNLSNINPFVKDLGYSFKGILNGEANISGVLSNLIINSDIEVDKLIVNNEDLGETITKIEYNSLKERIDLKGIMKRGVVKTVDFKGYVSINGEMDVDIVLDKVRMKIFEPFVEGILSELYGDLSGELSIKGKSDKPKVKGLIRVQKASFLVDYLKTRYNFTQDIEVTENSFEIKGLKLVDQNVNYADITGKISHNYFTDFKLNFQIDANKLLLLNTGEKDNSLFYGTALASGIIGVTGDLNNIDLKINARTERGTKFYIPLSGDSEIEEFDFISFVSRDLDLIVEEKRQVTGLKMDFDLQVTPDAEVQIIFDRKVGDIIRAQGNGNIKMIINTLGDFTLYGDYIIEQGDYLFTLQNIINKRFEVEKGGSITWNGDPYDAMVDIKAIYNLRTSLYDLTLDSTYKKRVPVECILSMQNNLMQPDIDFGIEIPGADAKAQSIIANLPPEEINRQIISLLVMNQFVTPETLRGGVQESRSSNLIGSNSSELLSNQLSHWLSQISKDFDVGVNYRPGDELSQDELAVALSTQILNDRVTINGNVGVGGQQQQTSSSSFIGDFEVEIKVNKSGKLRVKGFTKTNESLIYDTAPYRQGLGVFYREDFDSFNELIKKYWNFAIGKSREEVM